MKIPDIPYVPIGMDDETRGFLESLDDIINQIDVVRVEENSVYVLGRRWPKLCFEVAKNRVSGKVSKTYFRDADCDIMLLLAKVFSLGIYNLAPSMKQRKMDKKDYETKVEQYRAANLDDIKDKIKNIKVYQGTIDEVQRELGVQLKMVETGTPETFLKEHNTFSLMIKAYLLGADAIVHYQPNCVAGTPVKFLSEQ